MAKGSSLKYKPINEEPKPYQPYGNIKSTYQELHPGSKPRMR